MEEPIPMPPDLAVIVRQYQRMTLHDSPPTPAPVQGIRTDGELDAQTLAMLDDAYPVTLPAGFAKIIIGKTQPKSISQLWQDYAKAQAAYAVDTNEFVSDPKLALLTKKTREVSHHYLLLEARLQECEEQLHSVLKQSLIDIVSHNDDSPEAMDELHRTLTILIDADEPLSRAAQLDMLPSVMMNHGMNMDKISDFWREKVPKLKGAISSSGVGALNSVKSVVKSASDAPTIIHYSFDSPDHETDINPIKKTGPLKATDIADFSPAEQNHFKQILPEFSSVANLQFIEVKGEKFPPEATTRWRIHNANLEQSNLLGYASEPTASRGSNACASPIQSVVIDIKAHDGDPEYLRNTLLHETGHALGLKHPFDLYSNNPTILDRKYDNKAFTQMSYDRNNADGLRPLDIATLQYKYGTASNNTGNTRYILHANSPARIIHDTYGRNVLDISDMKESGKVNIIDISGETYNLEKKDAIVRTTGDTKIEKVIGSSSTDTIFSGMYRHHIQGNGGCDTIVIPSGGQHYIDGFNPEKGESLRLPKVNSWQTKTLKNGDLFLTGISKYGDPVSILIRPDNGVDAKTVLQHLHPNMGVKHPGQMLDKFNKDSMKNTIDEMQAWLKTGPIIVDEVSDIRTEDASRIRARPAATQEAPTLRK